MEWVHLCGAVGVPFALMLVVLSFLHALEGTVAVLAYGSGRPPIFLSNNRCCQLFGNRLGTILELTLPNIHGLNNHGAGATEPMSATRNLLQ